MILPGRPERLVALAVYAAWRVADRWGVCLDDVRCVQASASTVSAVGGRGRVTTWGATAWGPGALHSVKALHQGPDAALVALLELDGDDGSKPEKEGA